MEMVVEMVVEMVMIMVVVKSVGMMFMVVLCVVVSFVSMFWVVVRFVRMAVIVAVIMASMRVTMPMMSMAECCHANDIDYKSESTDSQQFFEPMHLTAFGEPLDGFIDNFNADEPRTCKTLHAHDKTETYIKKIPLANPASVSILPNPYGNLVLGGHLLITAAQRPTTSARQSKNMCMLSDSRPNEPVAIP